MSRTASPASTDAYEEYENGAAPVIVLIAHANAIIHIETNQQWNSVFAFLASDKISVNEKRLLAGHLLHVSIAQKDLEKTKRLLALNPLLSAKKDNLTPIQLAAKLQDWTLVQKIAATAETDSEDTPQYGNALLDAAIANSTEAACALITAGAKLTTAAHTGYYPIHYAILHNNLSLLTAILRKYGTSAANLQHNNHRSPLSLALYENNIEAISKLLEHGAIVANNINAIFHAAQANQWDAAFACLNADKISIRDKSVLAGHLLHAAIAQKNLEITKRLLAKNALLNIEKNSLTPIQLAATLKDWNTVREIAEKIDVDSGDTARYGSALLNAAEANATDAALALVATNTKSWCFLIGNHTGYFAIHFAILNNNLSLITAILRKHGSEAANLQHRSGTTPLSLALNQNNIEATSKLRAYGATITNNTYAMIFAAQNKRWDIIFTCFESGRLSEWYKPAELVGRLLHEAIEQRDLEKMKKLVTKNPSLQAKKNDLTPMHLAAKLALWNFVQTIAETICTDSDDPSGYAFALLSAIEANANETAHALIAANAKINIWETNNGNHLKISPVHLTILNKNLPLLTAILKKYGTFAANLKTSRHETPLSLALLYNESAAVSVLLAHGATMQGHFNSLIHAAKNQHWHNVFACLNSDKEFKEETQKLTASLLQIALEQKNTAIIEKLNLKQLQIDLKAQVQILTTEIGPAASGGFFDAVYRKVTESTRTRKEAKRRVLSTAFHLIQQMFLEEPPHQETLLFLLQETLSANPTWHGKTENSRTAKLIQRLQDIIGVERPSVSTAVAV